MREHKYRGIVTAAVDESLVGTFVYGSLLIFENNDPSIYEGTKRSCSVDPETVGQFTGLTDKNGVEIFEGDIVRKKYNDPQPVTFGQTEGADGGIIMGFEMPSGFTEDMEIVGNIHEVKS